MSMIDPISRTQPPTQSLERSLETGVSAEALAMIREDGARKNKGDHPPKQKPEESAERSETAEQINLPDTTGTRLNTKA